MKERAIQACMFGCLVALAGCSGSSGDDTNGAGTGGTASTTGGTAGTTGGTSGSSGTGASGGTTSGSGGGGTGGSSGTAGTSSSAGTSGTTGSGGTAGSMCPTTFVATDADNYKFHSELTIDVTKVKPNSELTFDWSGVKKDLLGHDVNLADIGMVEIGLWNLTLDQFEQKLNDDSLAQSDLSIIATILPSDSMDTSGSIWELTETGQPLTMDMIAPYLDDTKYPPATHVYTAMVANGTDLGQGTRMIQGFQLDPTSTNTKVSVTSDSTKLSLTADLHSLTSPKVPVGNPAITVDWDSMTKTAAGLPFDPQQITQVRVGKYSLMPAEMEAQDKFLNLDAIADTMYRAIVTAGTSFDLSKTKDMAGNAFTGIDDSHTWIVALNCGACANPAPWYLTVLKPCTAP